MNNRRYMYTKLGEETPMFSVTPGKNCRLYPYLWTQECADYYGPLGNPADNPFRCKAQGPVDPGQAYLGYPINFEHNLAGENCTGVGNCGDQPPIIGDRLKEDYCQCNKNLFH